MRRLLGIMFMLLLTWSCTDDRDNRKPDTCPVQFSSGLKERVATRAVNDSWDVGDKVGIYMIPAAANASDVANFSSVYAGVASNVPYYTPVGGTSVSLYEVSGHAPIVFPADDSPVNFVGYYPYKADTHTTNGNVYKVNVTTQSPSEEIDLLYHKGTGTPYDRNTTDVPLAFAHRLSKLKINLSTADGVTVDLTGATVRLTGFPATANFDLSTGMLDMPGTTDALLTPVKLAASESRVAFEAIVVPHENGSSYIRTVTFTIQGMDYWYALSTSDEFEEGLAHSYNFKFMGNRVMFVRNTIVNWGGDAADWGDYSLAVSKTSFDLSANPAPGNTIILSTNALPVPTWTLSEDADSDTGVVPSWITGVSLSAPIPGDNGWTNYTMTFDVGYNTETAPRTGYIRLRIDGLTLAVRVNQAAGAEPYVNDPVHEDFSDMLAFYRTGCTFTIKTNVHEPDISVSTTNTAMIMNLTKVREAADSDGSFIWTIGFDLTTNEAATVRSGDIHVTIGGISKTVSVSQRSFPVVTTVTEANCYMVAIGPEGIEFGATRAFTHGGAGVGAQLYATVLWDDSNCIFAPYVTGTGDATTITVFPAYISGNAVIAVRTGSPTGAIVWSYHIWVTAYTGNATWTNNGYTFMDRNLGASAAGNSLAGRGLFYQWGRKDPFPGIKYGTAGYAALNRFNGLYDGDNPIFAVASGSTVAAVVLESIRYPTTFYSFKNMASHDWLPVSENTLWHASGGKSVYDPCPAGWRVPLRREGLFGTNANVYSPWNSQSGQNWNFGADTGGANWGPNAIYPAAGRRTEDGGREENLGTYGYYWTASVSNSSGSGFALRFTYSAGMYLNAAHTRASALSVRCVTE